MDEVHIFIKFLKFFDLFHKFSLWQKIFFYIAIIPILFATCIKILKLYRKENLWDNLSHKITWWIMGPVIVILISSTIILSNIEVYNYKFNYYSWRFQKTSTDSLIIKFAFENNSDLKIELKDVILFFKVKREVISNDTAFTNNVQIEYLADDYIIIRMPNFNIPIDEFTIINLPLSLKYLDKYSSCEITSTAFITGKPSEKLSLLTDVTWDTNHNINHNHKVIFSEIKNVFAIENSMYYPNPWRSENINKDNFRIENENNKTFQIVKNQSTFFHEDKNKSKEVNDNDGTNNKQRTLSEVVLYLPLPHMIINRNHILLE